jgi:hypothetical protein
LLVVDCEFFLAIDEANTIEVSTIRVSGWVNSSSRGRVRVPLAHASGTDLLLALIE